MLLYIRNGGDIAAYLLAKLLLKNHVSIHVLLETLY